MSKAKWAHYYTMSLLMNSGNDYWWARVNSDGTYILYDRHGRATGLRAASFEQALDRAEQHAVNMTAST